MIHQVSVANTPKTHSFNLIWTLIFVIGSLALFIGITNNTLWYDEAFTGALVRHSFVDVVEITAGDKHAPLYFIFSKFITLILGNNEFSLRTPSLLGVIALAALGFGPVKRILGGKAALLYTLLVFVTPAFVSQALNARMYTWAAFFCTSAVLYAYLAATEDKVRDWIIFSAAVVAGMYTHVYVVLECFCVYVLVFIWLLIKDRKKIIKLIISAAVVSLLYLPWSWVVISQATDVAANFWIPPPTSAGVLFGTIFMPFQHEFCSSLPPVLLCLACVLGVILLFLGTLHALKNRNNSGRLFFMCLAVCIMTITGAFALSFIVKPILMPRYLISILGLYILVWVFGILQFKNRIAVIIAVCLLLAVFVPQMIDSKKVQRNGPIAEVLAYLEDKVGADDAFVHSNVHSFGIFCYYYPQYKHLLLLEKGFIGCSNHDAFAPSGQAGHDYVDFVKGHGRVWLVNRIFGNYSLSPQINHGEFERHGKLKKVGMERLFTQAYSFLALNITEFTPDPAGIMNETELFSKEVK